MEHSYHSTSHLGKMNCDRYLLSKQRTTVTMGDLETWAEYFAAMLQVAIFKDCGAAIRTCEENLKAISLYANELKAIGG